MPTKLSPEEKQRREEQKLATKIKKDCLARILQKKDLNPATFPREMKLINHLVEKYPGLQFWRGFQISFYIPSFAWFLTEKGSSFLAQEYRRATTDLSPLIKKTSEEQIELFNEPVEKVEVKKKMLTLRDFLK